MADRNERQCARCGSLLHHEADCLGRLVGGWTGDRIDVPAIREAAKLGRYLGAKETLLLCDEVDRLNESAMALLRSFGCRGVVCSDRGCQWCKPASGKEAGDGR